jgi:hypothetical protein
MQARAESNVAIVYDPFQWQEESDKSGDLASGMVKVPMTCLETGAWREEVGHMGEGPKVPSDPLLNMSRRTALTMPPPQALFKQELVAPNAAFAPAKPLKSIKETNLASSLRRVLTTVVLLVFAIPVASLPCPAVGNHALTPLTPHGNDMDRGCSPGQDYCDGTNSTSPKYLCGDWRLGPVKLPTRFPLDTATATYDRLGGLCPKAFLAKYWNPAGNGSWAYPPVGDGFQLDVNNTTINGTITLPVGTLLDRFGGEGGSFVSPVNAPYMQRALPPSNLDWPEVDLRVPYNYHVYEVLTPFNVSAGPIASWFEQPGQGVQYHMPSNISTMIGQNYLRNVSVYKLPDS